MERTQAEITQIDTVVAQLGECPVWNADDQSLYWEDIDGRAIHRYDPATGETESTSLPGRPGSFVFTQTPGRLLVATETSFEWLDWASGELTHFAAAEDPSTGNRLNDGRCDAAGRFIAGTMHPVTNEGLSSGSLYSLDHMGKIDTLETDVGIPNGLVFDPQRERMYWADTFTATIWVWDYDLSTGMRSNKRVFFDYSATAEIRGVPDGACLDAEGCYWSASVTGWALTRIAPDGNVLAVIDLPVSMPTMLAFGGADLTTMYVTSLQGGPVDEKRSAGVPAGALLSLDLGVAGVPEPKFAS